MEVNEFYSEKLNQILYKKFIEKGPDEACALFKEITGTDSPKHAAEVIAGKSYITVYEDDSAGLSTDYKFPVNIQDWFELPNLEYLNVSTYLLAHEPFEVSVTDPPLPWKPKYAMWDFTVKDIISLIEDPKDVDISVFCDASDTFSGIYSLIIAINRAYERATRLSSQLAWLKLYGYDYATDELVELIQEARTLKRELDRVKDGTSTLADQAKKQREDMDKFMGFKVPKQPVKFTQPYDAGWIAPDGKVFAANGTKANFIHIALADVIFEYYNFPDTDNRDYFLEKQNYLKFHDRQIQYCGYTDIPEIGLTPRQLDKLKEYCAVCDYDSLSTPKGVVSVEDFDDIDWSKQF